MARVTGNIRRKQRVRYKLRQQGNGRIRLSVFRSGKHMYAQLIDDKQGTTLASASTIDKEVRDSVKNGASVDSSKSVGALIAKRAKDAKVDVNNIVFDRGSYLYHGRVKALADAAREAGLKF